MTKLQGPVLFASFEKLDTFNWIDPTNGLPKPIMSFKVLLPHGDGTITRESITLPPQYRTPHLTPGEVYGFPVTARVNKKKQLVTWDARADLLPFPLRGIQDELDMEA